MTDERETLIREVDTLARVRCIKDQFLSKLTESKILFKKQIDDYFLGEIKVLPFPQHNSREYVFKLNRSFYDTGGFNWEVDITDKEGPVPWESILPYRLLRDIAAYPTDPGKTVHITDFIHKGCRFNLSFIKYIDEAIAGVIQKFQDPPDDLSEIDLATLDMDQYGQLPQHQKEDIFFKYFNTYPQIREKVLFNFFHHILPQARALKEVT